MGACGEDAGVQVVGTRALQVFGTTTVVCFGRWKISGDGVGKVLLQQGYELGVAEFRGCRVGAFTSLCWFRFHGHAHWITCPLDGFNSGIM